MAVKQYWLFISSTRILTARERLTYQTPVMETGYLFKRPIPFFMSTQLMWQLWAARCSHMHGSGQWNVGKSDICHFQADT